MALAVSVIAGDETLTWEHDADQQVTLGGIMINDLFESPSGGSGFMVKVVEPLINAFDCLD